MKRLLLLLLLNSPLQAAMLAPSSKTIDEFSKSFSTIATTNGVMDATSSTFVSDRIGDLGYFKNYFRSANSNKNKALIVAFLFCIPVMAKIYKDSRDTINEDLKKLDDRRSELEGKLKVDGDDKLGQEKGDAKIKSELDKLPSRNSVIVGSITRTLGGSLLDVVTDPFTVKNSMIIIFCSCLAAYYCANSRDWAAHKFRSTTNLLNLLSESFKKKITTMNDPKLDRGSMLQQVGLIDGNIKQIIDRYKVSNNFTQKIISFFEMALKHFKD